MLCIISVLVFHKDLAFHQSVLHKSSLGLHLVGVGWSHLFAKVVVQLLRFVGRL